MKKALIYLNCGCQLQSKGELELIKDDDVNKMLLEVSPETGALDYAQFMKLMSHGHPEYLKQSSNQSLSSAQTTS